MIVDNQIKNNVLWPCLLLLIVSLAGNSLQAQNILGEISLKDVSNDPAFKTTILRNPERALVIIKSSLPDLEITSNNQVHRIERKEDGIWQLFLVPGTHRIKIKAPDYISYSQRVFLSPKQVKALEIVIVRAPEIKNVDATLQVTSEPDGATLQLNGEMVGTTPYTARAMTPGTYLVIVEKSGYLTYRNELALSAGENRSLYIALDKIADPILPVAENGSGSKRWIWLAGGAVVTGAAAVLLLGGSGGGGNGNNTPGIPPPVFPDE